MANGSAVKAFGHTDDIEMTVQNLLNYTPTGMSPASPVPLSSGLKSSISVPGTPISGHSQVSMKASSSFTNLRELPSPISSISVQSAKKDNQNLLGNNISASSIEDNDEQKLDECVGLMPNVNRQVSLDYKPSNLDSEEVLTHRQTSSFS